MQEYLRREDAASAEPGPPAGALPPDRGARARAMVRALRTPQWAKNVLVLVPLTMAHELADVRKLAAAGWCFVAFSLCASGVYVLNDLIDVEADRQHPRKRERPFASGVLGVRTGATLIAVCLAGALGVGLLRLPRGAAALLALYAVTTTAYSLVLKRKVMLDVLTLAALYTLRILAGGVAVEVRVSEWLLVFSMFFFLSLAFAKRFTELSGQPVGAGGRIRGRGYFAGDLDLVRTIGPVCGVLAVLVLALYVNLSSEVGRHYPTPAALYLVCPVVLYWITRMWFLAQRRELEDDPVVFALRDRISLLAGLITLLLFVVASWDTARLGLW